MVVVGHILISPVIAPNDEDYESTYAFVAASVFVVGVARFVIFRLFIERLEVGASAEVIGVAAYLVAKVELKSALASLVPINVVIVVEKAASLLRAVANSFNVSKVVGAEFTIPAI